MQRLVLGPVRPFRTAGHPPGVPAAGGRVAAGPMVWALLCCAGPRVAAASPGQVVVPVVVVDFDAPRPVDPTSGHLRVDGHFRVSDRQLAVIKVSPGDIVTARGDGLELGLGFGSGPLPSGVVFWPGSTTLRVPSWSRARFAVARSASGRLAEGLLLRAARVWDAREWHRYERSIAQWLVAPAAQPLPAARDPDLRGLVDELQALVALAGQAGVERAALADYLMAYFQREAARLRPLRGPFHVPTSLTVTGGRSVELDGQAAWRIEEGQTLELTGADASLVRVAVHTQRPGLARVELREGDGLARVIERSTRGPVTDGWSPPSNARLSLPTGSPTASVRVTRGTALVKLIAYRRRGAIEDLLAGRPPRTALATVHERLLMALHTAVRSGRSAARVALLSENTRDSGALRLVVLLEAFAEVAAARSDRDALLAETLALLRTQARPIRRPLARALLTRVLALGRGSGGRALSGDVGQRGRVGLQNIAAQLARGLGEPAATSPDRGVSDPLSPARTFEQQLVMEGRQGPWAAGTALARAAWRAIAPYRELKSIDGLVPSFQVSTPLDERDQPNACSVWAGTAPRWTLIAGPQDIEVVADGGTHALVRVRPIPGISPVEATLRVDGVGVVVHGAAGLGARLALRPGRRRFVAEGAPLLVRVPRVGPVPCTGLRELRAFYSIGEHHSTRFALPAGIDDTAVRLEIQGPARFSHLSVWSGSSQYVAWLRGPTRLEMPSGRVTQGIAVSGSSSLLVRALARAPRAAAAEVPRMDIAPGRTDDPTVPQALAELRALTRASRVAGHPSELAALRARRAHLLRTLGQRTAAEADDLRAGKTAGHGEALAVATMRRASPTAASLPTHARAVVPLGLASRLPPLPGSRLPDPRPLLLAGRAPISIVARVLSALPEPEGNGSLLLSDAVLAERAGLRLRAARSYAALGRLPGAAAALERAARLTIDEAAVTGDRALVMRALQLSLRASVAGARAVGPLARISPGLRWTEPIAFESSAGTRTVESFAPSADDPLRVGDAVRRSLCDAPEGAPLLRQGRALVAQVPAGEGLKIRGLCHALEGEREPCEPEIRLAGRRLACGTSQGPVGGSAPSGNAVAQPIECDIAPTSEPRLLEYRMPQALRAIGWAMVTRRSGEVLSRSTRAGWHEVTAAEPLSLTVLGPTVVRLRARALGDGGPLAVEQLSGAEQVGHTAWDLAPQSDPNAHLLQRGDGSTVPVGGVLERNLLVEAEGPVRIVVRREAGRALIRLEVAEVFSSPPPRVAEPVPQAVATWGAGGDAAVATAMPPVSDLFLVSSSVLDFPVSVGASAAVVARPLQEDESRDSSYGQFDVFAVGPLVPRRLWLGGGAFGRLRAGPNSGGAHAQLDWAPTGLLGLRVFGAGRATTQGLSGGGGLGLRASAGALATFVVTPDLRLRPFWRATLRRADARVSGHPGLDPEVYSRWADNHPRTASVGLMALHQIWSDTLQRYQLSMRADDGPRLDRLDGALVVDSIPGPPPWPWLRLSAVASHRPATNLRQRGYLRTTLGVRAQFWRWLWPMRLVTLSVEVKQWVDAPAVTGSVYALSGMLVLAVERFSGEGLSLVPPAARVLRGLREVGSGLMDARGGGRLLVGEAL